MITVGMDPGYKDGAVAYLEAHPKKGEPGVWTHNLKCFSMEEWTDEYETFPGWNEEELEELDYIMLEHPGFHDTSGASKLNFSHGIMWAYAKEYAPDQGFLHVSPARWQRMFGVPSGLTYAARKKWIHRRCVELLPGSLIIQSQADAVAMALLGMNLLTPRILDA
jgi:hypothetical protein